MGYQDKECGIEHKLQRNDSRVAPESRDPDLLLPDQHISENVVRARQAARTSQCPN